VPAQTEPFTSLPATETTSLVAAVEITGISTAGVSVDGAVAKNVRDFVGKVFDVVLMTIFAIPAVPFARTVSVSIPVVPFKVKLEPQTALALQRIPAPEMVAVTLSGAAAPVALKVLTKIVA
jgi:hypothetical protein